MATRISQNQKRIYLGFLLGLWILIMAAIFAIRVYDNWYIFALTLIWALVFFIYQKKVGIRTEKKTGAFLGDLPKKDTYKYFIAVFVNTLSISLAISMDIKFLILVGLASAYQFYVSYKMIDVGL